MTKEQVIDRIQQVVDEYEWNRYVDHPNYFAEDIIEDLVKLLTENKKEIEK